MGITGNLRTMELSDLLQWLSQGRKNGTLEIRGTRVTKNVHFKDGRILSTSSNDPREYLGQYLMSHGFITEEELTKAMEVQAESKILLGKILTMINAVSEEDLARLMILKAEESIYEVFLWKEGEFEFHDGHLPDMALIPLALDVTGIIMEGLRRYDDWKRIRVSIASNSVIPVLTRPIPADSADLIGERSRLILDYVNGRRSIEEIALQTRNSEFVVAKTIFDLLIASDSPLAGVIQLAEAGPVPPPVSVAPVEVADMDDTASIFLRKGRKLITSGQLDEALRILHAALNVAPASTEIKAALVEAEERLRTEILSEGITFNKVPELRRGLGEMTSMAFSPNEGFILSRINGRWDVKSILQISPMRELDALQIIRRLVRDGIVTLNLPASR